MIGNKNKNNSTYYPLQIQFMCKKEAISTQLTGNEFGVSFSITFMCLTWLLFQLDVSVKWLADVGEVVSAVGQDFLIE